MHIFCICWYKKAYLIRLFHTIDGNEITHWIASGPSFITAVTSFVFEKPSYWNIQALSDCQLMVIDRSDHVKMLDKYPRWLEFDKLVAIIIAYFAYAQWKGLTEVA